MDTGIIKQENYLPVRELQAIERMSEANKPYIQAKNDVKISQMDRTIALFSLTKEILQTINISGQDKKFHLDEEQIKNVSKFVYNYVLDNYKGITLSEVRNAFKMGITHEFGDYVGYGVSTFSKFIKSYMISAKREQAQKEWMKLMDEPETTDKPTTEFLKQNLDIANSFFDILTPELAKHMENSYVGMDGTLYHLPSIYDFLREKYVIEFTPETKNYIITTSKQLYYHYIKKSGLPKHRQQDYTTLIDGLKQIKQDDLYKTIDCLKAGDNRTFDYTIKATALKVVLLKLKEKGKRIENLKPLIK